MESQFDCNNKFKDKINETPIEDMRFQPVGRDKNGMAYWYFLVSLVNNYILYSQFWKLSITIVRFKKGLTLIESLIYTLSQKINDRWKA